MKKLLVWDGDQSLWNGVIMEGDIPALSSGRLELCQELCDRGVLQSVASHNNPDEVEAALHSLGLASMFLYNYAGIGVPKSAMIRSIVKDYDLSRLSDVVFLDDDAINRLEVQTSMPEVIVEDPKEVNDVIARHFTKEKYTEEDRLRVRRYQSEKQRKTIAAEYPGDTQAFLRSCGLEMTLSLADGKDMARVYDLAARANRMAAIAEPLTPEVLNSKQGRITVAYITDKYGDYGLSAFIIAAGDTIDGIVVSCRLQGRGIGSALLGSVLNRLISRGSGRISASWVETEYNAGMRSLYQWYGFDISQIPPDKVVALLNRQTLFRDKILPDWVKVLWH